MRNLRGAGPVKRQPVLVFAAAMICCAAPLFSARTSETSAHSATRSSLAKTQPNLPDDLQLSKPEQRKAASLAAFGRGVYDENNGEPAQALYWYRRTLDTGPGFSDLAIKVAYDLNKSGHATQAIETLKDAIKASPREQMPYLYISQLYAKYLKKYETALHYADAGLKIDPKKIAPYIAIYEIHLLSNRPDRAEKILDRAMKIRSKDPQFWLQLGRLYQSLLAKNDGDYSEKSVKKLNAVYAKALSLTPNDPNVVIQTAENAALTQQYKAAIPLYQKAISLTVISDPATATQLRSKLARVYLANSERDKAIKLIQEIIKNNPQDPKPCEFLAQIYEQKSDYENARVAYQQAILAAPNKPNNYLQAANASIQLGQPEKAIAILQAANQRFSGLPQLAYSLGIAYELSGKYRDALAAFANAEKEAGSSQPDLLDGAFYFHYGVAAERAGFADQAESFLQKSITLNPASAAAARNELAAIWIKQNKRLDEAEKLVGKALEADPENPLYRANLGWFYLKKGDAHKALGELLRAKKEIRKPLPAHAIIFQHLGDIYEKLGELSKASEAWKKACALAPPAKVNSQKTTETKISQPPIHQNHERR